MNANTDSNRTTEAPASVVSTGGFDYAALLRECVSVIDEMRSENRLHGHICDASARWLNRVKPRVEEVLSSNNEPTQRGGQG